MTMKELASFRKEMEEEARQWLGSCADDAFIAGVEWMCQRTEDKLEILRLFQNTKG